MKSITTQEFFRFTDCNVHNEVLYGDFINNKGDLCRHDAVDHSIHDFLAKYQGEK